MGISDFFGPYPHRYSHILQMHADQGIADIQARMCYDMLHSHRMFERFVSNRRKGASRLGLGHNIYRFITIGIRRFLLQYNSTV